MCRKIPCFSYGEYQKRRNYGRKGDSTDQAGDPNEEKDTKMGQICTVSEMVCEEKSETI